MLTAAHQLIGRYGSRRLKDRRCETVLVDVGSVDSFPDKSIRLIVANGHEIGIVHWNAEFFALRNICPHQAGPVCKGFARPRLVSPDGVGKIRADYEHPVLACPWHGWEFDVRTGRSILDENYSVRAFRTTVENGHLMVELGGARKQVSQAADPHAKR